MASTCGCRVRRDTNSRATGNPSAQSRLPSSLTTARDSPSSRASFIIQSAIDRPAGLSGRQVAASALIGDDRRLSRGMESYGNSREGKERDGKDKMGDRERGGGGKEGVR